MYSPQLEVVDTAWHYVTWYSGEHAFFWVANPSSVLQCRLPRGRYYPQCSDILWKHAEAGRGKKQGLSKSTELVSHPMMRPGCTVILSSRVTANFPCRKQERCSLQGDKRDGLQILFVLLFVTWLCMHVQISLHSWYYKKKVESP